MGRGDPEREDGAPVVADQVDRLVDPVELAEQPVDVVVLGGTEAGRPRVAEARAAPARRTARSMRWRMPSQMAAVSGTPCTKTITARTLPP